MKIGILTQSMAANYGCNLQAYALQTTLERMGHDVIILDRWHLPNKKSFKDSLVVYLIRIIKDCVKFCLRRPIYHTISTKQRAYFWQNFLRFQKEYLHLTCEITSSEKMKEYATQNHFDVFIVGSDQVWRPAYNMGEKLYDMYLLFTEGQQVIRLSYAASFGVDNWEYTAEQTRICKELIKKFDAISVREQSGLKLCSDYLGVEASHVLDPTLLLEASDYNSLIDKKNIGKINGGLFCYILDTSSSTMHAIDYVERTTGLKRYICLPLVPENSYNVFSKESCVLPSPEEWLRCFRDAEMVLVDSFHGMVFSIIYNKPFWVIGNVKRGMARFNSLLSLFNLENRMVASEQIQFIDLTQRINWDCVNAKREEMVAASKQFLLESLN